MNGKWHRTLGWILVGGFLSATAALVAGIAIIARRPSSESAANLPRAGQDDRRGSRQRT
jgi:hypothetical protein